MAKMKTLQPRIKNLQETYAEDREKLGRAMMELYQREKVNPVAGCLPIIIQIPVFLAFYWAARERGGCARRRSRSDPRPLLARSAVHPAGHHGGGDVRAVQAHPGAAGPGAGQGVHGDAAGDVQ
jgi:YidC/Oxa1 family membrane protein insertase